MKKNISTHFTTFGSFPFVPPPPQLSVRILFAPPDARAIFLYNGSLCNGKCYVTGADNVMGAQTEKVRAFFTKIHRICFPTFSESDLNLQEIRKKGSDSWRSGIGS